MADSAAYEQEYKADKRTPAKIDHADPEVFAPNNTADKLTCKKSGNSNNYINKDGKDIAAGDQVIKTAVKRGNQYNK